MDDNPQFSFETLKGASQYMTMSHFGVIDIGSNSVKLSIARFKADTFEVVFSSREGLRLLEGDQKVIQNHQVELLKAYLLACKKTLAEHKAPYQILATSAMRRAENQRKVIDYITDSISMNINVISGEQEAQLVFRAHLDQYSIDQGKHIILDIGGGSLECIQVQGGVCQGAVSLPLGVVVLKDQLAQKQISFTSPKATRFIKGVFKDYIPREPFCNTTVWMGGGSPNAVLSLQEAMHEGKGSQSRDSKTSPSQLSLEELEHLQAWVQGQSASTLIESYHVKPHRVDLVPTTLFLMKAMMHILGQSLARISDTGIREGLFASIHAKQKSSKK